MPRKRKIRIRRSSACSKRGFRPRPACRPSARKSKRGARAATRASPTRRAFCSTTGSTPITGCADGRKFAYHHSQREAIETLIYLYEVAKVRRHKALVESFATRSDLRLLQYDEFARYCVKMATGSGKTKVMSLAIAWQFFNAVAEARDDFAKTFLSSRPT